MRDNLVRRACDLAVRWRLVVLLCLPLPAAGKQASAQSVAREVDFWVGSELADRIRDLQLTGEMPVRPWSVRGLSDSFLLEGDSSARVPDAWRKKPGGRWQLATTQFTAILNSTVPSGENDGAVWAGRGLTLAAQGGGAFRAGPLSVRVLPIAFIAQNAKFPLAPNGQAGQLRWADARYPRNIDLPQRFGDTPYGRIDPGQSHVRVSTAGVALSLSTENLWWGPATRYPFILGANAPGFLHLAAGTSAPVNLWVARVHGQLFWGRLDRSPFVSGGAAAHRFATGGAVTVVPRGVEQLEFGAARFFHARWTSRLRDEPWLLPFQGLLKKGLLRRVGDTQVDTDSTNQLASAFARVVIPSARLELYGEIGREDHAYDLRDLILSPEHTASRMVGVRHAWGSADAQTVLTLEIIDYRATLDLIMRDAAPTGIRGSSYIHGQLTDGHTQRGQLLGAPVGVGSGAAQRLVVSRVRSPGRIEAHVARVLRSEEGSYRTTGTRDDGKIDVLLETGLSMRSEAAARAWQVGIRSSMELNRQRRGDTPNLALEVRYLP